MRLYASGDGNVVEGRWAPFFCYTRMHMHTDWEWVEGSAECSREELSGKLVASEIPPLEILVWDVEAMNTAVTDQVVATESSIEAALSMLRATLLRQDSACAAGIATVCSADTFFTVWGLTIESPNCLVQYIEHRLDGSRLWVLELDLAYLPMGEWNIQHLSYLQLIDPVFPMGRAIRA